MANNCTHCLLYSKVPFGHPNIQTSMLCSKTDLKFCSIPGWEWAIIYFQYNNTKLIPELARCFKTLKSIYSNRTVNKHSRGKTFTVTKKQLLLEKLRGLAVSAIV